MAGLEPTTCSIYCLFRIILIRHFFNDTDCSNRLSYIFNFAHRPGFEPGPTVLETGMLPLH